VEGSERGPVVMFSQHLPGETEEYHECLSQGSVSANNRTEHFPSTSQKSYHMSELIRRC
jgi:hypothetical protein